MKKFLGFMLLAFSLCNPLVYAETGGLFLGVQGGLGSVSRDITGNATYNNVRYFGKSSGTAYNGAGIIGVKGFANDFFGLRVYGVFSGGGANVEDMQTEEKKFASITKMSGNADFLFNFVSNDTITSGFFIGANYTYYSFDEKFSSPFPFYDDSSAWAVGVNVGFRTKGQIFGTELGVNIPTNKKITISKGDNYDITMQENVTVFFRLTFNFDTY